MSEQNGSSINGDQALVIGVLCGVLTMVVEPITGLTVITTCVSVLISKQETTKRVKAAHEKRALERELQDCKAVLQIYRSKWFSYAAFGLSIATVTGVGMYAWWDRHCRYRHLNELARLYEFWQRPRRDQHESFCDVEGAPADFKCVITGDLFHDPVVCADGHTYERAAIEDWFARGNKTSPLTNQRLRNKDLIPNHALRRAVEEFVAQPTQRPVN